MPSVRATFLVTMRRLLLCLPPAAVLMAVIACGNSSSASGPSCSIVDGIYTFTSVGSGGPDCVSGTYTNAWPPAVPSDAGNVAATCTTAVTDGQCTATCSSSAGPTTVTTYALTAAGFSGTTTSPVDGPDGGIAYTCTYTFSASRNQ